MPVRPRRPRVSRPRVVASMFTTAGLIRSTTSAKLMSVVAPAPATVRAGRAGAPFTVPVMTVAGVSPPAKIAPTRNATTAVKAKVTKVKRRDIVGAGSTRPGLLLHYKSPKRLLIQRFDAELARFLEFAPRIAAGDQV